MSKLLQSGVKQCMSILNEHKYVIWVLMKNRLDQIVKVVRQGQTKRAPIERVADIVTGYFVPVVTFLAVIVWVIWLSLGFSGRLPASYLDIPIGGWSKDLYFKLLIQY